MADFNPVSFAAGAAVDFANTAYANRLQTKAAHQAQDFSAQQYASRYQTQVADLKAAGLNPMLAYGQSPGSAPSGVMAQQHKASTPEAVLATAQAGKINEERKKVKEETDNIVTLRYQLDLGIDKIGAEIKEIQEKINTNKATQSEIKRKIELMAEEMKLIEIKAKLGTQQYNINVPEEIVSGTTSAVGAAAAGRFIRPAVDIMSKMGIFKF